MLTFDHLSNQKRDFDSSSTDLNSSYMLDLPHLVSTDEENIDCQDDIIPITNRLLIAYFCQ